MSKLERLKIPLPQLTTIKRKGYLDVLVNGKAVSSFPQLEYGTDVWGPLSKAIEDIQSQLEEEAKKSAVEYHKKKDLSSSKS